MSIEISLAIVASMTVGLVQVAKMIGVPPNFCPLAAIVVGVGLSLLATLITTITWPMAVFAGIISGLMAVGLWSGVKNSVQ